MIRNKHFLLICLTIILFLPVQAQSYNTQQIELAEQLQSLAKNAPPEMAYIQTSKDIYETGEDLWFKVYLLDAQYLTPSFLSKTLYLQLLNENTRKVVWEEKYEIQNGTSNGKVYLESTLPEGDYFLAAYTPNSFFDNSTEFKAVRRIKIKTDIISKTDTLKSAIPVIIKPGSAKANSIQFTTFPEGGNLVSGIQSNLAFKAVNQSGEPVEVEGTLFEDSNPLLKFKSIHAGMGSFDFTPDAEKKYHIRLSEPAIDSSYTLPEISLEGMTMKLVARDKESLSFKIIQNHAIKENEFYIRVQCRGVVYGLTTGKVSKEIMIKIPLFLLPQGIAEITLFNSSLIPVAERLVFINMDRKLNISAELSKNIYPVRGKAKLKITVRDEDGYPIMANLGVTVFDKLYQNPRDSNNILSHAYLSSQIKGRIYNPSFYFNTRSRGRDEALDLLMLTQGWRKYIWSEDNLTRFNKELKQVIFDGIKGELFYQKNKKKIIKEQKFIWAFSPNKDSSNIIITSDSTGKFTVSADLLKEWENDYVYLKPFDSYPNQLAKKNWDPLAQPEFNLLVKSTDPFGTITQIMQTNEGSYPIPSLIIKEMEDSINLYKLEGNVIRIKEVTIKGPNTKPIRGKYMGTLDSLAKSEEDYVCVFGVINCPRHPRGSIADFWWKGTYKETKPISGKEYFITINYNTPAEYSRRVTYYSPKYTEEMLLKINNLSRVKAYYGNREFYQPNYDLETDEGMMTDFRNTLLWKPSVITDENGEATLSFFCSDINSDFVGRIEGMSEDGLLGIGYFNFSVRKVKFTP